MSEHLGRFGLGRERKVTGFARMAHKAGDAFSVEIVEGGLAGGAGVPWGAIQLAGFLQEIHEAGIDIGQQIGGTLKPPADKLGADGADEILHFGVLVRIVRSFDENEARNSQAGSFGELQVRRRKTVGVFPAVFTAKQADVNLNANKVEKADIWAARDVVLPAT